MRWVLNGTDLGPYKGLSEKHISHLKWAGAVTTEDLSRIDIFESTELPQGTLELRTGRHRVAVIRGLGK